MTINPYTTYLTAREVAAVLRVSAMTVYRLIHAGEIPSIRVGRAMRIPEKALAEYLAAQADWWEES